MKYSFYPFQWKTSAIKPVTKRESRFDPPKYDHANLTPAVMEDHGGINQIKTHRSSARLQPHQQGSA